MAQIFFLAVLFKDNLDGAKICKHKISHRPSCWYMPILGPTQGHRLSHRGFGIGTNFMKIGVHITRGNTWPRRSVPLFGCFRRSPEHHSILLVTLRSHIYSLRHLGIENSETGFGRLEVNPVTMGVVGSLVGVAPFVGFALRALTQSGEW